MKLLSCRGKCMCHERNWGRNQGICTRDSHLCQHLFQTFTSRPEDRAEPAAILKIASGFFQGMKNGYITNRIMDTIPYSIPYCPDRSDSDSLGWGQGPKICCPEASAICGSFSCKVRSHARPKGWLMTCGIRYTKKNEPVEKEHLQGLQQEMAPPSWTQKSKKSENLTLGQEFPRNMLQHSRGVVEISETSIEDLDPPTKQIGWSHFCHRGSGPCHVAVTWKIMLEIGRCAPWPPWLMRT